jgi:hypothetical protein
MRALHAFLSLLVTGWLGCGDGEPGEDYWVTYRLCSDSDPCPSSAQCHLGICVPTCPGAPPTADTTACTEGQVCWEDGCRWECDEAHPCTQAFECVDGECVYQPCENPDFWPYSVRSTRYPIVVHYRDEAERSTADEVLEAMDHSWQVETEDLGFWPPVSDRGSCGPDDGFDVFLWRTMRSCGADVLGEEPETEWDDYRAFMILDPWGPYGGENLAALVAHELSHAMQAAYDWWETPIFFEMTSQFVEDEVYDDNNGYRDFLYDYQGNPDWAFDYYDDYETWYMYGSMLYLRYLRDHVYDGDPSFVAEIWDRSRNPPGDNEPDFEDALESMLGEQASISFLDSVVEFSRWRYFTGERDDGRHFEEGETFPEDAMVAIAERVRLEPGLIEVSPGPMLLGVQYVQVYREDGDPTEATLSFEGDDAVRWSVQAVPGLEAEDDGEILEISSGTAPLRFGSLTERAVVVLALPDGADDPEDRDDTRHPFSLTIDVP